MMTRGSRSKGLETLLGVCVVCCVLPLSFGCSKKVVRNGTVFGLDTLSLGKSVESDENLKEKGIGLAREKHFEKAIEDFTKALSLKPDYYFAYNNLGLARMKLEDYGGAVKAYTKAIELKSDFASAYFNQGSAKEMLRDPKGACNDWKRAADLGLKSAAQYATDCE